MGLQRTRLCGIAAFLLCFLNVIFTFGVASAQDEMANSTLTYKELVIQVMPQYVEPDGWEEERPAVLVGQHGTLENKHEFSYDGEIRVPVPSDNHMFTLSMVGIFDEEGIVHDVEASVDTEAQEIVWETEESIASNDNYQFVIEYFIDPYEVSNDTYTFSYHYELERRADDVSIIIFEPFGSEEFTVSEEPDRELEMFGVPAYAFEKERAEEGEGLTFLISYDKADRLTTLEALENQMVPNDEIHAQFQTNDASGEAAGETRPLIELEGAIMISISLIIASLFVFFGFRARAKHHIETIKPSDSKDVEAEQIRALRQQLIRGEIDEETYNQVRTKSLVKEE
ncbi:hypothetical protein HXA34_00135 [Salipaludibacillus agaradhaerens]|uniref:DUF2207 domain-containing protein n=1 Tax=Salipaludibacillus agaradhaerens TaxID=76935 RepID=UPI002151FB67|nr:DUF2207 domain-containing protein [Salipaludibacillus agaradhaerens]MCR6104709.1 hypothetical protein [Salipaludibacillus agaradhaerens]MCR6116758.1 hypothetical protein [Salipaludibacillus agaradhaerens]